MLDISLVLRILSVTQMNGTYADVSCVRMTVSDACSCALDARGGKTLGHVEECPEVWL